MTLLGDRVRRYLAFLHWFLADAFLRYRGRLMRLVMANLAGLACHSVALLIVYQYAQALESDRTFRILGAALSARSSFELLFAVATVVLALMLFAALLTLRARIEAIALARDYGDFCSQRIYVLASRMPCASAPEASGALHISRLNELARPDAIYCGTTLRTLARALLPIGTAVVAGIALVALDPLLTLSLAGVFAIAAVFLYRASLAGAHDLSKLRTGASRLGAERRTLLQRVTRSPAALEASDTGMAAMFRAGVTAKVADATAGQREAIERGNLIAQVAVGCAVFLILVVKGGATLRNESNWSALVGYLGAFSIFASSFAGAARLLVAVSRFYPRLAQYARFVQDAEAVRRTEVRPPDRFRLDAPNLAGGAGALEARRGERLALVLPGDIDRHALTPLAAALRGIEGETVVSPMVFPWFAIGRFTPLGGSLRENFGLPASYERAQLDADLAALGLRGRRLRISKSMDQPLTPAEVRALEPSLVFALSALSGIRGDCAALLLEHELLAALGADATAKLLDMARRCLVLIAYPPQAVRAAGNLGEQALVVSGPGHVLGWASIESFRAGDKSVMQAIAELAAREPSKGPPALESELQEELS